MLAQDASPSPAATPQASASGEAPVGSPLQVFAKEDTMPRDELFAKSRNIVGAMARRINRKADARGVASLSEIEKDLLLPYQLDSDQRFGGLSAYFGGMAADHALRARDALKKMGAQPFVSIVDAALEVFPNGQPLLDQDARQKQIRALPKAERSKWDALDKDYRKLPDLVRTYIEPYARAHREEFSP